MSRRARQRDEALRRGVPIPQPKLPPIDADAEALIVARRSTPRGEVVARRFLIDDSITEITQLLHRAYAEQVRMGLKPLAGRQDDAVTTDRIANSECYLALLREPGSPRERIVGVILFDELEKVSFPSYFLRDEVAHFAQFGVDPDLQGCGVGHLLLEVVEARARAMGFKHLALSMAEPDAKLRAFYERRGFAFVEYWQWPYTNYRSCILSKPLT
jgi:GNAT superfamily N-acetyltransferase